MIENKQFNRIESENENYYINEFGYNVYQDYTHTGYIKCKLAHITNLSIIIPDKSI